MQTRPATRDLANAPRSEPASTASPEGEHTRQNDMCALLPRPASNLACEAYVVCQLADEILYRLRSGLSMGLFSKIFGTSDENATPEEAARTDTTPQAERDTSPPARARSEAPKQREGKTPSRAPK